MAKDWARKFYKSKAWQSARRAALARTGGLCEWCLKDGKIVPADEVHHTVELTPSNINIEEISLNPDLLVPLCHQCHDTTKHKNEFERRYTVDESGNVTTNGQTPPGFVEK